jgi:hypothetical protein
MWTPGCYTDKIARQEYLTFSLDDDTFTGSMFVVIYMLRLKVNIFSSRRKRSLQQILISFFLLTLLFAVSCEPLAPIEVRNGTTEPLMIFINDNRIGEVAPQMAIKNNIVWIKETKYNIVAKNSQGNIVYSELFTDEDLDWVKWRIVIPSSIISQK